MKMCFGIMVLILLPVFIFAEPNKDKGYFYEYRIPYKTAKWSTAISHLDFKTHKKTEYNSNFIFKSGKLKIVTVKIDPQTGKKKTHIEILDSHNYIEFNLPENKGIDFPVDCRMNMHYVEQGSAKELMEAALNKTEETETLNGIQCAVYSGSISPGLVPEDKNHYLKEWRNIDGFVIKKIFMVNAGIFGFERIETVHDLEADVPISNSEFDVPSGVSLEDEKEWLKNHPLKDLKPR